MYKLKRPEPKYEQSNREKKARTMAYEMGLTREERTQLTMWLPGIPADHDGSWKGLTEEQYHDLLTMMEGFLFVSHLFAQRG